MAVASVNPPLPFLLDYLLASTWTWLAIFLAPIAATFRALRGSLPRRRLLVNLESSQPPSSMAISSASFELNVPLFSMCTTEKPSFPSTSLPRSFRRRARSKSTSALEKLHRNGEGFLRSSMDILSSVLDAEISPCLKKITSVSKLFKGDSACENAQQRPGLGCFAKHATAETGRDDLHDSANLGFKSGELLGLGIGKGALVQEKEAPYHSSVQEELLHLDEDVSCSHHWLPSWAFSLCDPLQRTFSYPSGGRDISVDDLAPLQVSPCFEIQFGWDKLLESRLGSSWNSAPVLGCRQCRECTMENPYVVKMWTGKQKNLLKTLHVDCSSTLALDVWARCGQACTGNIVGGVSLWELGREACAKASVLFANSVSALSMNSEQGAVVVGGANGLGLWDQRSSTCNPFGFTSSLPHRKSHISALKSRGNGLCVVNDDHFLSLFDLRKLHGDPLFSGPAPHISSNADEDEFEIWETLTCDFEEDAWEEDCVSSNGDVLECHKGSSWLSWFSSIMRVSSTSVP